MNNVGCKSYMILDISCAVEVNNVDVFTLDLKKYACKKMHSKASEKAEPEHLIPR